MLSLKILRVCIRSHAKERRVADGPPASSAARKSTRGSTSSRSATATPDARCAVRHDRCWRRACATAEAGAPGAGQDSYYNMQGMFAGAGGYNSMQYVQAQYAQHVSQQAHQAAGGNGL